MIHKNSVTRIGLIAILIMTLAVPTISVAAQPNQRPAEGAWPVLCNWRQSAVWQGKVWATGPIYFTVTWEKTTGQMGNQVATRYAAAGTVGEVYFYVPSNVRINWITANSAIVWDWAFCGNYYPAAMTSPKLSDDSGKSPDILITVEPAMPVK